MPTAVINCHSVIYHVSCDARLHSNRLDFLVIPGFLLSHWLEGCWGPQGQLNLGEPTWASYIESYSLGHKAPSPALPSINMCVSQWAVRRPRSHPRKTCGSPTFGVYLCSWGFKKKDFIFYSRFSDMKVTQSCPTLCAQSMGFSRPEYWSGIFPFSRGSSQPRERTQVSCIAGRFFTSWATREA